MTLAVLFLLLVHPANTFKWGLSRGDQPYAPLPARAEFTQESVQARTSSLVQYAISLEVTRPFAVNTKTAHPVLRPRHISFSRSRSTLMAVKCRGICWIMLVSKFTATVGLKMEKFARMKVVCLKQLATTLTSMIHMGMEWDLRITEKVLILK